jgi:hypothetical protein
MILELPVLESEENLTFQKLATADQPIDKWEVLWICDCQQLNRHTETNSESESFMSLLVPLESKNMPLFKLIQGSSFICTHKMFGVATSQIL